MAHGDVEATGWQTIRFICVTCFVPIFGPCIMDYMYHDSVEDDPNPALPSCRMPMNKCDGCLAFLSLAFRPLVASFIFSVYAPIVWAAKWGAGSYCFAIACMAVALTVALIVFRLCCPQRISEVKTEGVMDIFLTVVDMKCKDAAERKKQGPKWILKIGLRYLLSSFYAVVCCRIFRPSAIYTFAKTLFSLLITDVAMAVAVWLYITGRFLFGSFTWTVLSGIGWLKELLICNNIKNRIMFLAYPEWHGESAGKEKNPRPKMPGCCCKCDMSLPQCPSLPSCPKCCPKCCGCDLVCEMCDFDLLCEFNCTMCSLGLELCDNLVSILTLVGKALVYTDRQLELTKPHELPVVPQAWQDDD